MAELRSFVIEGSLPYPPVSGQDLRNWQNVCGLRSLGPVGVFGLRPNHFDAAAKPSHIDFWRRPAKAPPINQILAARAWPFDTEGHPADGWYSDNVALEVSDAVMRFDPHVIIVEGVWLYRYIDVLKKSGRRLVVDCHNVEANLYQEIADSTRGDDLEARLIRKLLPRRTKIIEQKAVRAADQIWVCSENDARAMKSLYGGETAIQVVANSVDVSSYEIARAARRDRPGAPTLKGKALLFPGAFGWQPNRIAASFLIKELFPRLAVMFPDVQLVLAGSDPTTEMIKAAREDSRIVITGAVADMRHHLADAGIMVVPLLHGGGTRFKILEAFAAKLPVISTRKGAEGLAVKHETHLLIAESADEFVTAINRLWSDDALARHLAENGLALVTQNYSREVASRRIAIALNCLECFIPSPKTSTEIFP
jgi:glycosyltransferase involved in cell wall biosynthesis